MRRHYVYVKKSCKASGVYRFTDSDRALYTDAKKNLSDAIRFACEGIRGVYVAFDGIVINGTHAMKIKQEAPNAI